MGTGPLIKERWTRKLELEVSRHKTTVRHENAYINAFQVITEYRGTQRQFWENICSEDDLRSRIFETFAVKFLACLPVRGFSNI